MEKIVPDDTNEQSRYTKSFNCDMNALNECINIFADNYWKTYADDGVTETSKTTNSAKGIDKVTFTTTNSQTNEVTNTVICLKSNADWENGTCKAGTAIE